MRLLLASVFSFSLCYPALAVCPTGNHLANSSYVLETHSWLGYGQSVSSGQLHSFSDLSMELATISFGNTPTNSTNTPNFSASNFTTNYGATLYNGRAAGLLDINVASNGNVDTSVNASASSVFQIYYTYNAGVRAPLWQNDPSNFNGQLKPTATRPTYPGTCYIYIWLRPPSTVAPFSPPDAVAVIGNSGAEIVGQQVSKEDSIVEAKSFRGIRQ